MREPDIAARVLTIVVLLLGSVSSAQGVSRPDLIGAWLITETTVTTPAGTEVDSNPQPGIYVFTERHFSTMLIPGAERPRFSEARTDEERLAAYDNFAADAGTYEITGSELVTSNILAKTPNGMNSSIRYGFSLEGDFLVLTLRSAWAPEDGEIVYRLRRLE